MGLNIDTQLLLTEGQRQICEGMIERPRTYEELAFLLYGRWGIERRKDKGTYLGSTSNSNLSVQMFLLKKRLKNIGIKVQHRTVYRGNKGWGFEFFFTDEDAKRMSE